MTSPVGTRSDCVAHDLWCHAQCVRTISRTPHFELSGPICQPQRDWLGLHSVWGGVSGAVLNKLYWCRGGGLGSGPYCSVAQLWLMLQECLHVKERQGVRHYWHYDALSSTVCGDGVVRDDGGEIRWGASSSPPILPISGLESLDFAQ